MNLKKFWFVGRGRPLDSPLQIAQIYQFRTIMNFNLSNILKVTNISKEV